MKIKTYLVDAFTDTQFKGNTAGVCLINEAISDASMQAVAKEFGFSETAFVTKTKGNQYAIRYFSPKIEIPLCGHATLAAAKVLFQRQKNLKQIHFKNIQSISLHLTQEQDRISMLFPIYETHNATAPAPLLKALGLTDINNCEYNSETNILILEIEDSEVLQKLNPDFEALTKSHNEINGVLVTTKSKNALYDFESRYFWPWSGTNEDPVTGSSHTFLAKYWSKRLGKTKMQSFQCSERSGFMEVELVNKNLLTLKSKAQIVFEGYLYL